MLIFKKNINCDDYSLVTVESNLEKIPTNDHKTREILLQMKVDENKHGELASSKGSVEIPNLVKKLMSRVSKIMINISYRF